MKKRNIGDVTRLTPYYVCSCSAPRGRNICSNVSQGTKKNGVKIGDERIKSPGLRSKRNSTGSGFPAVKTVELTADVNNFIACAQGSLASQ